LVGRISIFTFKNYVFTFVRDDSLKKKKIVGDDKIGLCFFKDKLTNHKFLPF